MTLKSNTKQLLILLYSQTKAKRSLPIEYIKYLWPELSPAGRKSLCRYLKDKQLISIEKTEDREVIKITDFGKTAIELAMPNLKLFWGNWRGCWLGIFLVNSPVSDPEFRRLRTFLKKNGSFALTRAVYLCPDVNQNQIQRALIGKYQNCVYVWQLGSLIFGDQKILLTERESAQDELIIYSKISKEINNLLDKKNSKKRLTDREIIKIFHIFNRLFDFLENSSGLFLFCDGKTDSIDELITKMFRLISV